MVEKTCIWRSLSLIARFFECFWMQLLGRSLFCRENFFNPPVALIWSHVYFIWLFQICSGVSWSKRMISSTWSISPLIRPSSIIFDATFSAINKWESKRSYFIEPFCEEIPRTLPKFSNVTLRYSDDTDNKLCSITAFQGFKNSFDTKIDLCYKSRASEPCLARPKLFHQR